MIIPVYVISKHVRSHGKPYKTKRSFGMLLLVVMQSRKQDQWSLAKKEVRHITDKLGMSVDKNIIDTVTVLRLLGFHTTGSCGGHVRRTTRGPYVNIQSIKSMDYTKRAFKVQSTDNEEYRRLCQKANYHRAQDLQRLVNYLSDFYDNNPMQNYSSHLIVHSMPTSMNILQCQGAEIAFVMNAKARAEIVHANQREMTKFTEYLKDFFFKND